MQKVMGVIASTSRSVDLALRDSGCADEVAGVLAGRPEVSIYVTACKKPVLQVCVHLPHVHKHEINSGSWLCTRLKICKFDAQRTEAVIVCKNSRLWQDIRVAGAPKRLVFAMSTRWLYFEARSPHDA